MDFDVVEPNAPAMLESMRAVGYTPQSAVADLVDNSLSAGARNVWIQFEWDGRHSSVSITDDGSGMTSDELVTAMRLGSRSPLEPRNASDLGRFGLGLKTASFSQCRRLTVWSRRKGRSEVVRQWDLDYVGQTGEWRLLRVPLPGTGQVVPIRAAGGTCVLWQDLDRLVGGDSLEDAAAHRRFLEVVRAVEVHLAMVFHRYLEPPSRFAVHINGAKIRPWDPFMKSSPATQSLSAEVLRSTEGTIKIQGYVLPHHSKLSKRAHEEGAGPAGWNGQQGFYVYRNRRLLLPGDWLHLGFKKEEHFKLARIQIDLPNAFDSEWLIDVKKSSARPPGELRDDLRRIAQVTRQRASEVYRHRGKVLARKAAAEYSFVWERIEKRRKVSYRVNRGHPLVEDLLSDPSKRLEVERVLRLIEETVPAPLIALDASENPEAQAAPFEGAPSRQVAELMERVFESLRSRGLSVSAARSRIGTMEPFANYPELLALVGQREMRPL